MEPKTLDEKSIEKLLDGIAPEGIAEGETRRTVETLLNVVEQLVSEVGRLRSENQQLRDENNRLKGEQGKPDIKGNSKGGMGKNHSSEQERHIPNQQRKGSKKGKIQIDRSEIVEYPPEQLPEDAQFKGYVEVVVQDVKLSSDHVLFRKEKYYSATTGETYVADLPLGYEGEFGPGVKALVFSLYYGGNMTQGKLIEFLEDLGLSMSAGHLSNLLIKQPEPFGEEQKAVYQSGLASSPWQHFDQTGARVGGVNYTTNVVCNPWYTVYVTTPKKDRLSVLESLQPGSGLQYLLSPMTFSLLETFQIPQKWQLALAQLPQGKTWTEPDFHHLLDESLPQIGSQLRARVLEAAAIAYYHQQMDWPVIRTLVCDDAPQFKAVTETLSLCWVHEGRHYKKLTPVVAYHQRLLDEFLDEFWDYYRALLAYRTAPSATLAQALRAQFGLLFGTPSGYQQLDERKRLSAAKVSELLLVLEHPELPLHNNPAELAARTMVQRRNISYATQTSEGTKAWDTFMSLVDTTRKLGISFFHYVRDRISNTGIIPPLADTIREQSLLHPLGISWLPV